MLDDAAIEAAMQTQYLNIYFVSVQVTAWTDI